MKFYHGTRDSDLKELNLEHSGKIYLTDSYEMAFLYAANPIRIWRYDKAQDKLIFREVREGTFKTLYGGKKCYIFECECDDFVKCETNPSNHTFVSNKPVKLGKRETITDAYQKLLELEKEGRVVLWRWEDYTDEQKTQARQGFLRTFNEETMKEEKKYPESYQVLISLFPELEVKK